jgi:hypothetical protein
VHYEKGGETLNRKEDQTIRLRTQFGLRALAFTKAVAALGCGALIGYLRWLRFPHIDVRIFNETDTPLSDLRVESWFTERTTERPGPAVSPAQLSNPTERPASSSRAVIQLEGW